MTAKKTSKKKATRKSPKRRVKFTQIAVRHWSNDMVEMQSSVVALGDDGCVYQYQRTSCGWVKLNHTFRGDIQ